MKGRFRIFATALVVAMLASRAFAGFVLVKRADNKVAKLSSDAVKAVFSNHTKTWSNGDTIILVIGSEDSPAMQWLAPTLFKVSAKTYLTKIKQDVFKGDMRHPLSAEDDAATLKRIASTAGVIGWVTEASAKNLPAELAVLSVE
jgi:ABC-type phosphate transport system substrate-binding protein